MLTCKKICYDIASHICTEEPVKKELFERNLQILKDLYHIQKAYHKELIDYVCAKDIKRNIITTITFTYFEHNVRIQETYKLSTKSEYEKYFKDFINI